MTNEEIDNAIIDKCIRFFVRNKIGQILKDNFEEKDVEKVLRQINENLVDDFLVIAKDECSKFFKELEQK